ncbi:MAG: HNH endonuclease [Anaeromyxobacter sp.]|nr:HNH endonuclease [Anaeromyxobacter sp.]
MLALDPTLDPSRLTPDLPPATLAEARVDRDALARLLAREREAAADFLLAVADFDRRRGWERLGHASLFAFLTRELGLSNGAAWLRLTAARLLPRHPAVETALRGGRLCLSAVGELARVLTAENEAEVLPRFYGRSSREAREVAAAILPRSSPPQREVVTAVAATVSPRRSGEPAGSLPLDSSAGSASESTPTSSPAQASPALQAATPLRAHEVGFTHPARAGRSAAWKDEVEPLDADLRRLHVTVPSRLLRKVATARDGLSHARPGATTAEVLEAALDLLLERQARAKALVKRPRKLHSAPASTPIPPAHTAAQRPIVPAPIEREVRRRDGDRCQFPLDAGGVCGATWQLELDHVVPLALGGETTAANLRCCCAFHNRLAAEAALGRSRGGSRRKRPPPPRGLEVKSEALPGL